MNKYIKLEDIINLLDSKLDELKDKLMNNEKMSFYEFSKYLNIHGAIYELKKQIEKKSETWLNI